MELRIPLGTHPSSDKFPQGNATKSYIDIYTDELDKCSVFQIMAMEENNRLHLQNNGFIVLLALRNIRTFNLSVVLFVTNINVMRSRLFSAYFP